MRPYHQERLLGAFSLLILGALLAVAVLSLAGCGGVPRSYLELDKQTLQTAEQFIKPELHKYWDADPSLTEQERDVKRASLDAWLRAWRIRLEEFSD